MTRALQIVFIYSLLFVTIFLSIGIIVGLVHAANYYMGIMGAFIVALAGISASMQAVIKIGEKLWQK